MKHEEFAFFNQQLAAMLRSGIPLEGALLQLGKSMQAGRLREEMAALQSDLAQGVPWREALPRRSLPRLYVELAVAGVQGNDLPGVLILLADHYRRVGNLWLRLRALMVYPAMVYFAALVVFGFITCLLGGLSGNALEDLVGEVHLPALTGILWFVWLPLIWLLGFGLVVGLILIVPRGRQWLGWHLPGFREAHLARLASALQLMLGAGTRLPEALHLAEQLEGSQPVRGELRAWQQRIAAGHGRPTEFAQPGRAFPPLFTWLISQSGDDLADGFGRAASIYFERARYRTEMLLYAALPVAVLALGLMIAIQVIPLASLLSQLLNLLGSE